MGNGPDSVGSPPGYGFRKKFSRHDVTGFVVLPIFYFAYQLRAMRLCHIQQIEMLARLDILLGRFLADPTEEQNGANVKENIRPEEQKYFAISKL